MGKGKRDTIMIVTTSHLVEELKKCTELEEEQGYCKFSGKSFCDSCGVPALINKLVTGNINDNYHLKASVYLQNIEAVFSIKEGTL